MESSPSSPPSIGRVLRTRIASGVVVLIPIVVTIAVLRFVFNFTAGILLPFIEPAFDTWPQVARAALSLAILVAFVYVLGLVATNLVGRRLLALGESLVLKVPLVKVVYSVTKQVVAAFEVREAKAFKSVVFLEFPRPGTMAVGFVTSSVSDAGGTRWATVFVPTTPNPTTGFLQLVREDELIETRYTVEEGIKMVMSLGVLVPDVGIPSRAAS